VYKKDLENYPMNLISEVAGNHKYYPIENRKKKVVLKSSQICTKINIAKPKQPK